MIFYNGFNLLVDIILALIVWRLSYNAGFSAGYGERDHEIQVSNEQWYEWHEDARREGDL